MDRQKLLAELKRDEDLRLKPYVDTVGKTSIGIGRNLDDVGISQEEAIFLAQNDIDRTMPWPTWMRSCPGGASSTRCASASSSTCVSTWALATRRWARACWVS
ncbi:lysozyme [Cupriavidus basilensis OR16]|uniref:Lysozyme n=1 Tax=Cupriavidus basilensis OR16 TaxID=1127483 RepID=H1SDM2_9BURK|nr:lysozyme [Cupriavidus basilensis OR16]